MCSKKNLNASQLSEHPPSCHMYCDSLYSSEAWINRVSPCAPENLTGSAVPSCATLLILHTRAAESDWFIVLTDEIPPDFRGGVHLFIYTAIRHRVSPELTRPRICVPTAFTAENPPASTSATVLKVLGSFSNECCLLRHQLG